MNVLPFAERLFQRINTRDMRQNAQFDLAVVQGHQHLALFGNERLADTAAFLGPDGDVLQVRIGRCQAPRVRTGNGIRRVHAARFGVDVFLQRVGIGRFQLGQLTPVQNAARQFMLGCQILEHVSTGGIGTSLALFATLETHLVEQDLAKLLGRSDVKGLTCHFVNFGLKPRHFLRKRVGHARQRIAIHLDARAFHIRQNRHQGTLHAFIDTGHLGLMQLRLENLPKAQGDIRILGRVFRGLINRHQIKGDLAFARTDDLFDRDRRMGQIAFGQRVHAVAVQTCVHRIRQQHGVINRCDINAIARQNLGVVFHVLADFHHSRVFQQRFQQRQRLVQLDLPFGQFGPTEQIITPLAAMPKRDVSRLARLDRQGHTHQFRRHFVQAGGFGIDRHITKLMRLRDPCLQCLDIAHAIVAGRLKRDIRHRRAIVRRRVRTLRRGVGNNGRIDPEGIRNPLGQRAELHLFQKAQQRVGIRISMLQIIQSEIQWRFAVQLHQLFRQFDLIALFDQGLTALGLLDLFRAVQQFFQRAEFTQQLSRRFHTDPRRARHVIDGITRQRLNIHHAFGIHAEFLEHAIAVDHTVFHGVVHHDTIAHQLHQVLVRTHDRDRPARFTRLTGQRGDDVVGLVTLKLFAGDIERLGRAACQRDLRAQIFGHRLAVGLVLIVQIVAERMAAFVENHRNMRRRVLARIIFDITLQHVAKAGHSPNRQTIGLTCQRRQGVIGAKDESRSINQMQMRSLAKSRAHAVVSIISVIRFLTCSEGCRQQVFCRQQLQTAETAKAAKPQVWQRSGQSTERRDQALSA